MWKVRCTSFGPPGISTISGFTSANWKPFAEHVAHDARDLADQARIDERVEADLRVGFLQLQSIFETSIFFEPT